MIPKATSLLITALFTLLPTGCSMAPSESSLMKIEIDWPAHLAEQNVNWDELPKRWLEAPFLGNGMMGTMVYQAGERSMRWDVGRSDVQDHRDAGEFVGGTMYTRNRLPIGYFELATVGVITGGSMEMDLYHAEATGVIETDRGQIRWRSFVPTDHMAIITEIEPTEGEADCKWVWHALPAVSPRQTFRPTNKLDDYRYNPDPVEGSVGDIHLCTQPLLVGGETVTAWAADRRDGLRQLTVSVAHTFPETAATEQAIGQVQAVRNASMSDLVAAHRAWWHGYYRQSYVSIPDPYWQQAYWLQMYKLASGTRADRALLDLNGPWLQRTPWPGTWWNLNIQLTYWAAYGSNRLSVGESLNRHLYANVDNLIANVAEPYRHDSAAIGRASGHDLVSRISPPDGANAPEMGLLLWGLHNCYLHYRHSMNDDELRDQLYPLLKRAVNYPMHFLYEDDQGVVHLPKTFSPEYKHGQGPDCNFDLALLRWGCRALIDSAARLGIDDPLLPKWRDVLERIAPYPVDDNGYMIAAGVPFKHRHRHYSHLLMLYPLYLVNADQPNAEELAIKSINHWQRFGPRHGYAFTGASSLLSAFGRGNESLERLNGLKSRMSFTTMYGEIGQWAQCIETPLSAAQSIHDMLLQSWGNTIRVFPAVPDKWADVTFHDLRAEGAFLVSAIREGGVTRFVRIKSLAGEPCRVKLDLPGEVHVNGARRFDVQEHGDGVYTLDLRKGEEVSFYSSEQVLTHPKGN